MCDVKVAKKLEKAETENVSLKREIEMLRQAKNEQDKNLKKLEKENDLINIMFEQSNEECEKATAET